jgi:hypothetical protein
MCSLSRLLTPSASIDGDDSFSVDREKEKCLFGVFFMHKGGLRDYYLRSSVLLKFTTVLLRMGRCSLSVWL